MSTQLVCEGLISRGHNVTVITQNDGSQKDIECINGVRVVRIKSPNIYSVFDYDDIKPGKIRKLIWNIIELFNVCTLLKFYNFFKKDYDIVWTNNLSGFSISVWLAAKLHKRKIYHTLRDYYLLSDNVMNYSSDGYETINSFRSKLRRFFVRASIKDINIVGISSHILEKHRKYFKHIGYASVIYNPVRIELDSKRKEKHNGKITLGYIGQINKAKGIDLLLNRFSTSSNSARLLVAGKVSQQYKNIYIKNTRIDFIGHTEPSVFFEKVDALLVPSVWEEPFGRVVIEALSHKVPVYCSRKGGLTELADTFSSVTLLDFNIFEDFDFIDCYFDDTDLQKLKDFDLETISLKYEELFSR
ncbi:glycosyltransferase [Vibrio navarrensis]|uniref:glycosyltransferase n=1 Tax=Vibrio navarrensis TaxID=29495 RepID=UPI0018DBB324